MSGFLSHCGTMEGFSFPDKQMNAPKFLAYSIGSGIVSANTNP
jgi:hypothetical protein